MLEYVAVIAVIVATVNAQASSPSPSSSSTDTKCNAPGKFLNIKGECVYCPSGWLQINDDVSKCFNHTIYSVRTYHK